MFVNKVLIGLFMAAILKLECGPDNGKPELFVNNEERMTGLVSPHPLVFEEAKNLVNSRPITDTKYYMGYWGSLSKGVSQIFSSITEPIYGLLGRSSTPSSQPIQIANIEHYPSEMIYEQGRLNSCAHNAMALIIAYLSVQNSQLPTKFSKNPQGLLISRNYHYYNSRYEECNIANNFTQMNTDYGASLEGALLAIDKYGVAPENFLVTFESGFTYKGWGYNTKRFSDQPDPESYRFALDSNFFGIYKEHGINPYRVVSQNIRYSNLISPYLREVHLNGQKTLNIAVDKVAIINAFKGALNANNPIYFGTLIDNDFMATKNGYIRMPNISIFSNYQPALDQG